MITRRSFIASSAAFAAAGCASFGDNGGAANAPRFEFGPDGKFTFLHLTDLHLNIFEKQRQWLLCDASDQVLWVVNRRTDHRFRITPTTSNILVVEAKEGENEL